MKTIRLLLATGLALVALAVVVGALTWWQPATARAEGAAAAPLQSAIAKPLQEWWQGWYFLTLYNTGNIHDNYTIAGTVAGESWTTNWPTTPIGPVAAGGSAQFDVMVQIPSGALDGDWSRATITATSQGDGSKWDTAVLTTTTCAGTITRDVQVTPISTTVRGDPGDTVCFTLTVTNTGTVADTLDVTHTFPVSWTVTFTPPPPYGLGPGENQAVQACITIPARAGGGSTKAGVVTVVSQGDPSVSADVDVTVRVGWKFIYLPIVMRTYSP